MARASTRARSTADANATKSKAAELAKKSLDDLFNMGRADAPWRVLVYSENGGGKTTFLAHCPGVFFLPVEDGATQWRVPQWKGKLDTADALENAIDHLRYGKHTFKAVAIETLDAIEELFKDRVEQRLRDTAQKDSPLTIAELNEKEFGAGYDLLRDEWRMLLQRLDALREERDMRILLSAHDQVDTVRNLDGKDYQRHTPQLSGKKSRNLITGWADYVLRFESEVSFAPLSKTKNLAVAGGRIMRCTPTATIDAKCRGEVGWPEALPLDEEVGWQTFSETATLVTEGGRGLPAWLASEAARAFKTIVGNDTSTADERRAQAVAIFDRAMRDRHYARAHRLIVRADEEYKANQKITVTVKNDTDLAVNVSVTASGTMPVV